MRGIRGGRSFKPCCHGTRSAASQWLEYRGSSPRFQTLLSWKSVSGPVTLSPTGDPLDGFKPCCHGSRSAAPGDPSTDNGVIRFQTLLSWKSVSGLVIHLPTTAVMRFQTLLSWKSVSGTRSEIEPATFFEFQTLLSWKSVSGTRSDLALYAQAARFKPCCHGSRSAARSCFPGNSAAIRVSNLVVMEVGQRPA